WPAVLELGWLTLVGHADEPHQATDARHEHHGPALRAHRFGTLGPGPELDAERLDERPVAQGCLPPAGASPHTLPGQRLEPLDGCGLDASLGGASQDGGGERMLAPALE